MLRFYKAVFLNLVLGSSVSSSYVILVLIDICFVLGDVKIGLLNSLVPWFMPEVLKNVSQPPREALSRVLSFLTLDALFCGDLVAESTMWLEVLVHHMV